MISRALKYKKQFIVILLGTTLTACGLLFQEQPFAFQRYLRPGPPGITTSSSSNGEHIYFTTINDDNQRIPYYGGPAFGGMMMGSYLTCASCHGPTAQGGLHRMHMQIMDAPDIRYAALNSELEEHGEGEHSEKEENEEGEHNEYGLEDFRLAVVEGKHPNGAFLNSDMPRWQMNEWDLADVFEFLKSIP